MTMKKLKKTALVILIGATVFFSAITLAKYVVELAIDDQSITIERFFFRSDVLSENSDVATLSPITVYGKTTVATITNGEALLSFSDRDITWELQYYVDLGDGVVPVLENPEIHTLVRAEQMTTETLNLSPVIYEGVEYRDIIVEARSTSPYERILRARLQFEYGGHTLNYSYLPTMGVITLYLTTNADEGNYTVNWHYPLVPDNADPNGILTSAETPSAEDADGNSVTFARADYTTLRLYFFVSPSERSAVDAMSEDERMEWIRSRLSVYYE